MNYSIYLMENKINGKMYIGYTKTDVAKYLNQRKNDALREESTRAIHRAIRKYGWDSFVWYIIYNCETMKDAKIAEIQLIKDYSSYTPNGYNMTKGGDGSYEMSEKTREKLRKARAKQIMTDEEKKQRSINKIKYLQDNSRSKETIDKHRQKMKIHYANQTDEEKQELTRKAREKREALLKTKEFVDNISKKSQAMWDSYTPKQRKTRMDNVLKTRKERHGY